eukprot:IDg20590t1
MAKVIISPEEVVADSEPSTTRTSSPVPSTSHP